MIISTTHWLLEFSRWVDFRVFRYRQITKKLKAFGFEFFRNAAGSHEIWRNPTTGQFTTIPNHPGDMPEGTLRAILKQASISPEDFLKK